MNMSKNEKKRLMRVRKMKKKQRPSFVRVESWRYKKLSKKGWRKQRGIDNKTRRNMKMGVVSPKPGYRGPKKVRGLHPSGLEDILVINKKDLEGLNPKIHAIRIASRLGNKKKIDFIEFIREKGFKILNAGISEANLLDFEEFEDEEIEDGEFEVEEIEDGEFEDEESEDEESEDEVDEEE